MLVLTVLTSINIEAQQKRFLCAGAEPACPAVATVEALIHRQGLLPDDYVVILVAGSDWQRVTKAFSVDTPFGFTLLTNKRLYLNSALMSQAGSLPALVVAHETAHVVCNVLSESGANRAARKILMGFRERVCE